MNEEQNTQHAYGLDAEQQRFESQLRDLVPREAGFALAEGVAGQGLLRFPRWAWAASLLLTWALGAGMGVVATLAWLPASASGLASEVPSDVSNTVSDNSSNVISNGISNSQTREQEDPRRLATDVASQANVSGGRSDGVISSAASASAASEVVSAVIATSVSEPVLAIEQGSYDKNNALSQSLMVMFPWKLQRELALRAWIEDRPLAAPSHLRATANRAWMTGRMSDSPPVDWQSPAGAQPYAPTMSSDSWTAPIEQTRQRDMLRRMLEADAVVF